MNNHQALVREFHQKFGLTINDTPTLSPKDDALRVALIREELDELKEGIANNDRVETADALADLAYVIYGAGVTYGLSIPAGAICKSLNVKVSIGWLNVLLLGFESAINDPEQLNYCGTILFGMLEEIGYIAEQYSIPLDAVFAKVHRSNMSKLWTEAEIIDRSKGTQTLQIGENAVSWVDGVSAQRVEAEGRCWLVKRADGKALKSPSYSPADIAGVLARQEVAA